VKADADSPAHTVVFDPFVWNRLKIHHRPDFLRQMHKPGSESSLMQIIQWRRRGNLCLTLHPLFLEREAVLFSGFYATSRVLGGPLNGQRIPGIVGPPRGRHADQVVRLSTRKEHALLIYNASAKRAESAESLPGESCYICIS
jgi:hypothetical protein